MSEKKCKREMFLIGNRRFGCFGTRLFIRYRIIVFRFFSMSVLCFFDFRNEYTYVKKSRFLLLHTLEWNTQND